MNGAVHHRIVTDAVDYVRQYGSNSEKRAVERLDHYYDSMAGSIPGYAGTLKTVAADQALLTDHYHDLAISAFAKSYTEYDGHNFTALNHFVNGFWPTIAWQGREGYYYFHSSKAGSDSDAMTGWVDTGGAEVKDTDSLVLPRIRMFWKNYGNNTWDKNFAAEIRDTTFAPVSALAEMYYRHLLFDFHGTMKVDAGNGQDYVYGLGLLGPVFHAVADACVPQHVRGCMGFHHQDWENAIETEVMQGWIHADPELINQIVAEEPFKSWLTYTDHAMKGRFAVLPFINELASKVVERMMQSSGTTVWTQFYNLGENYWRDYMVSPNFAADAQYFYNLAIAGTIHVIVRAFSDLVSMNVIPAIIGGQYEDLGDLVPPHVKDLFTAYSPLQLSPQSRNINVTLNSTKLLGFALEHDGDIEAKVAAVEGAFSRPAIDQIDTGRAAETLASLESGMIEQYSNAQKKFGRGFCPLKSRLKSDDVGATSPMFGNGTYRLPSPNECKDKRLMSQYMDGLQVHAFKASLLSVTKAIAALRFNVGRLREGDHERELMIDEISRLKQRRDAAIQARKFLPTAAGTQATDPVPDSTGPVHVYANVKALAHHG